MLSSSKKGFGGQDCWDSRAERSAIESRQLRLSLDRVRLRCPVVRRGSADKIAGIREQRRVLEESSQGTCGRGLYIYILVSTFY